MARQIIDLGTVANDGTGTPLRDGGDMINDNFEELYAELCNPAARTVTASGTLLTTDRIVHVNSAGATTQTLPAAASMTGRYLTIRNVNSGVVTIDANGAELIRDPVMGDQLTLGLYVLMDTVTLWCGGSGWSVVNRNLRAHIARAYSTSALSVATATVTPVPMNGTQLITGLTFTSGADEPITVNRAGRYRLGARMSAPVNAGKVVVSYVYMNGSQVWEDRKASGASPQTTHSFADTIIDVAAGATIGARVWHDHGSNVALGTGFQRPELLVQEVD
jgi:hypothetical protein